MVLLLKGLNRKVFTGDHNLSTTAGDQAPSSPPEHHTHMGLRSCEIGLSLGCSSTAVGGASELARHNATPTELCEKLWEVFLKYTHIQNILYAPNTFTHGLSNNPLTLSLPPFCATHITADEHVHTYFH